MKNSVPIPSDVWEEKRTLIATLYKDEEWPLKQVIKKIRSDNFNPSETQLRSRLKKWRVTKPSRQTRKKSEETTKELFHETNFPKRHSNNSSPETQPRSRPLPSAIETVVTEQEWYVANKAYEPHGLTASSGGGRDIPAAWDPNSSYSSPQISPEKSRVSSHASLVITTPPSYDPPQPSPLMDGALLNSTSTMTPTFTNSPYALGADHSMPTPASTTTAVPEIQWAMPQWYPMPIETTTQASSMPFYASGPLTPPIDPMVHIISQQPIQQISESRDGLKLWEPPVSGPFNPELAAQLSQKARQPPKPLEKEVPHPLKISTSQYPGGVATPTSPFFHHGPYSSLCSPGYAYPGPETLVHRPSIEF